MSGQVIFKTNIFGGFDKKEVLGYIDSVTSKAAAAEEELAARIAEMTAAGAELSIQISGFEEKIVTLEKQLETERAGIEQLSESFERTAHELREQKESAVKKEIALKMAEQRTEKLIEHNRELEEKVKNYDEATRNVGAVLIEGDRSARKIVESAIGKVAQIEETVRESGSAAGEDLELFRREISDMRSDILETMNSLVAKLDRIDRAASEMGLNLETSLEEGFLLPRQEEPTSMSVIEPAVCERSEKITEENPESFFRSAANV